MTLREFLGKKSFGIDVTVYYENQPVFFKGNIEDDDGLLDRNVIEFGIISDDELWVDID